jgi:hypothetical protein
MTCNYERDDGAENILQVDCKKLSNSWIYVLKYWEDLDYPTLSFILKPKPFVHLTYFPAYKTHRPDFFVRNFRKK